MYDLLGHQALKGWQKIYALRNMWELSTFPAYIYLLKLNNINTRKSVLLLTLNIFHFFLYKF